MSIPRSFRGCYSGSPAVPEWKRVRRGIASVLVEVECLRTLDRLRMREAIPETEIAARRQAVYSIMQALGVVEPSRIVLTRAAQPLPTTLGTLDAIHLATAGLWAEQSGEAPVLATHDNHPRHSGPLAGPHGHWLLRSVSPISSHAGAAGTCP